MKKVFIIGLMSAFVLTFAGCQSGEVEKVDDSYTEALQQEIEELEKELEEKEVEEKERETKELKDKIEELEDKLDKALEEALEEDGTGGPDPVVKGVETKETFIKLSNSNNSPSYDSSRGAYYVSGTISSDCNEIFVSASNDGKVIDSSYKLEEYKAGDDNFVYRMRGSYGNLQDGKNVYTFTANCDGGKTVKTDFSLTFYQASMGINHEDYRPDYDMGREAYYVTGYVSSNCSSIYVSASHGGKVIDSNYKLGEYKAGDRTFTYRMHEDYGNMKQGMNTYTFTAYCSNDQVVKDTYLFSYIDPYWEPGFEQ